MLHPPPPSRKSFVVETQVAKILASIPPTNMQKSKVAQKQTKEKMVLTGMQIPATQQIFLDFIVCSYSFWYQPNSIQV